MREALLKSADHLQAHPEDYCFISIVLPCPGRLAGCALGWLAYFSEIRDEGSMPLPIPAVAASLLGVVSPAEFYDRMDVYNPGHRWGETWTTSARICAESLRAYANEFHPE